MRARRPRLVRIIDHAAACDRAGDDHLSRSQVARMEQAERNALTRAGRQPPLFVVVVRVDRCCGGPEEGGWWYDWKSVEEVRRVWGFRTLLAAVRELGVEYARVGPDRFSVIGGPDFELCVTPREADIETLASSERPTYC